MNKKNIHPVFIHGQGRGKEERSLVVASGVRVRRTRREPPSACLASSRLLVASLDSTTTIASCNSSLPRLTLLTIASRTLAPAPLCRSKNGALPAVLAPFTAPALYFSPVRRLPSLTEKRRSHYEERFSPCFYFSCATRLERIGKAQGTTDLLICGLCCTWPGLKLGSDLKGKDYREECFKAEDKTGTLTLPLRLLFLTFATQG